MKRKRVLNMTGLGLNFPRQATLEVLEILRDSDAVVSNLNLEGVMEFLSLFNKNVHTISFRGDDAEFWARKTLSLLKPGGQVAFVTRGHPLVSGHLALALLEQARREGVEVRSYSAVSTIDEVLCAMQETLQDSILGLQTYDTQVVTSGRVALQPAVPAILYLGAPSGPDCEPEVRRLIGELSKVLSRIYPKSHEVVLYHPPYGERRLERVALERFGARMGELHPTAVSSVVVYVPAA